MQEGVAQVPVVEVVAVPGVVETRQIALLVVGVVEEVVVDLVEGQEQTTHQKAGVSRPLQRQG